ncbi:MAG: DUF502 domain-containing protein [Myxococcales bacterium]|nr:DUF502 domain-containing protein [Myxococcales bacterium]
MNFLVKSFFKGLLILVPFVVSVYIVIATVQFIDNLIPGIHVPGVGLAITLTVVTAVGILGGNVVGRRVLSVVEAAIERTPGVKLLYSSIKDLLGAFVGEKKSFEHPVIVDLTGDGSVRALGFVTCRHFDDPKLANHVAVYLPQSYNFAGNLLVVPESRIEKVDADGAQFMAFVVSGGVSTMQAARTVMDGSSPYRAPN